MFHGLGSVKKKLANHIDGHTLPSHHPYRLPVHKDYEWKHELLEKGFSMKGQSRHTYNAINKDKDNKSLSISGIKGPFYSRATT